MELLNKLISFNCKSLKRSIGEIRKLCNEADVVALQETWLLSHDLSLLNTIHDDFGCTGTSAVDTSAGLLIGRPYGGVAILWRKSAFKSVSVIDSGNVRISAIKMITQNRSLMVFSVYMPVNSIENLSEFTECFGVISSILEENSDCEAAFVLGDFNAHPGELFCIEMLNFCEEQSWCCIDLQFLGIDSNAFTYVSEVHGSRRWLDHCIVTRCAQSTIRNISIKHDVYWSDHSPLIITCELGTLPVKSCINNTVSVKHQVVWGERGVDQIDLYHTLCNERLRDINLPSELRSCVDGLCSDSNHKVVVENLYEHIINILSDASKSSKKVKCRRKGGCIVGWNKYISKVHKDARLKYNIWVLYGRPINGSIYNDMYDSRKVFKSKLKWCQDRQAQIKMDILATNHSTKDFKTFWNN